MSGYAFRSKKDIGRIRSSVKATENAVRRRGSTALDSRSPYAPGPSRTVAIFRCGTEGCLQYKLVDQAELYTGNMSTLFNSISGWIDVDDACGADGGNTFQSTSLTAAMAEDDVVVLSTDNNRVYQRDDADGMFYEIP